MLSLIWKTGTKVKNWSYDYQLLDQVRVACPVVSVGNLSVGGTGKTPVTHKLYQHFAARFEKLAIVSRNYKAILRKAGRVDPAHPNGAMFYGDEPAWLAAHCPKAQVFVGPRKYETAAFAADRLKPELILVDDGFQHRALYRDLDLVLWDATSTSETLIPYGRLREDFSALERADYVLLTKVNWTTEERLQHWRNRLGGRPVVEVEFTMNLGMEWIARTQNHPVAAFAGLAEPVIFRQQLESLLQRELTAFWSFPDHHHYPTEDLQVLARWLNEHPDSYLFTTEKDAIKLRPWVREMARVVPVPLSVQWGRGREEFLQKLDDVGR